MTTSTYEVYGDMPTMEKEKLEAILAMGEYEMPEAGEETLGGVHQAENIEDSTATTVDALKSDFNDLLAALKAAGIMAPDEETTDET